MGWLTGIPLPHGRSVTKEIDALITHSSDGAYTQRVLRSALVAMSEYYAAVECINAYGHRQVWAAMFLVEVKRDRFGKTWGYKDMDESMGPAYTRCPLAILDLLTEPLNDQAAIWRACCRDHHARRARITGLKPGMRIRLAAPMRFSNGRDLDVFDIVRGLNGRGIAFMNGGVRYAPSTSALARVAFTVEASHG